VLFGFWAFTDTHRPIFRFIGALAHGGVQLALALVVAALAQDAQLVAVGWLWRAEDSPTASFGDLAPAVELVAGRLLEWGLVFLGGYLLGAVVMGLYLWIACAVLGRHGNEAFSGLRVRGWKSFLRIKIDAAGITVHALGVKRVGRFRLRRGVPVEVARGSAPELIDRFFVPADPPEAPGPTGAGPAPG
jgi:hypothetical protein